MAPRASSSAKRPRAQITFSLHHLNVESLDQWDLAQIFTALLLLLQVGLSLFLAVILDFLWNLNQAIVNVRVDTLS